MEQIKKLNRDILYKVVLKNYKGYSEYLLINANDDNEIFGVLEEQDIL